jgi:N-glycosidase YbiA
MGMPTLRNIQDATTETARKARTNLEARVVTLTREIASAIDRDMESQAQASAVQIAGTATAISNICKTLNEVLTAEKWNSIAETWRRTAELRGSAEPENVTEPITKFRGQYAWLSNMYPATVKMNGFDYPTVEHAYQAAKTRDHGGQMRIREQLNPVDARAMGNCCDLRPDWEQIKLTVMAYFLRQKFHIPRFKALLLSTGDAEIIEGNEWGDTFWGVCRGQGDNHLGILLMQIREELRTEVKG